MGTDNPVKKDLEDKKVVSIEEAYEKLHSIMKEVSEDREYLRQMHVEENLAIATDAHVLAALKTNQNGETKDYPAVDRHGSDAIRQNGDGESLENVCTHKNNKSQKITPRFQSSNESSHLEFPDYQEIYPETSDKLRIKVNRELLKKVLEIVSESDDGVILSFCAKDSEAGEKVLNSSAPMKVEGDSGVGLVMPVRIE